nr:hypothetical protein [Bacillus thuringiensis serovar israelensis]
MWSMIFFCSFLWKVRREVRNLMDVANGYQNNIFLEKCLFKIFNYSPH